MGDSVRRFMVFFGSLVLLAASVVPVAATQAAEGAATPTMRSAAKGKLKIQVTGLPSGWSASVTVKGPKKYKAKVTKTVNLKNLRPGTYKMRASPMQIGSNLYVPSLKSKAKVRAGKTTKSRVTYSKRTVPQSGAPVRVNLANATGVGLVAANSPRSGSQPTTRSTTGSNLVAVQTDGTLRDAVTSGTVNVNGFFIGPNEQVYLLFSGPVDLATSEYSQGGCILAQVSAGDAAPACVDSSLRYIGGLSTENTNPIIQFDNQGAIYYVGQSSNGTTVLRRNKSGVITDLISDQIGITNYLVAPNGTVFIDGYTIGSGTGWVRRVSPQGGLKTIKAYGVWFLKLLPDGNVYFGENYNRYAVWRYLVDSDQLDPRPWIDFPQSAPDLNAHYLCTDLWQPFNNECMSTFAIPKSLQNTQNGQALGPINSHTDTGFIVRYYPTPKVLATSVKAPTVSMTVLNTLFVAGVKADNTNTLIAYDSVAETEQVLLSPSQEVEIYHLDFSGRNNRLVFDGLRFSDNKQVIGQVNMSNGQVTMVPSGTKLDDLQAL